MCRSQLFLLTLLSALQPVETLSCLAPDDVSGTEHSVSPVLQCGTVCHPTFVLHQHCLLSKTDLRLICFCICILQFSHHLNSTRVCCTLRTCYSALQIVVLLLLLLKISRVSKYNVYIDARFVVCILSVQCALCTNNKPV